MSLNRLAEAIPKKISITTGMVKNTTRLSLSGTFPSYTVSEKKERENSTVSTQSRA
jgi:hypothetical protein